MLAEPLLSAPSPARRTSSCSKDVVTVCIIATGAVLLFATCSPATRPPSRFNAVLTKTVSADDSPTVVANETRARLAQITRAPVDGLSDGEEAVPRLRESDGTDAQERAGVMRVDASESAPSAVGRSPEIWLCGRGVWVTIPGGAGGVRMWFPTGVSYTRIVHGTADFQGSSYNLKPPSTQVFLQRCVF